MVGGLEVVVMQGGTTRRSRGEGGSGRVGLAVAEWVGHLVEAGSRTAGGLGVGRCGSAVCGGRG
jgi:hypothetical protein